MNSYVRRRLLLFLPTLLGSTMLVFMLVRVLPGDVADALLSETRDPKAAEQLRQQFGLDRPLPVQYGDWLAGLLHGDLGTSLYTHNSVVDRLRVTVPVTVELAFLAVFFSTVVGTAIGTVAAVWQDRRPDYALRSVSILGLSIPSFWLATLLLVLPGVWWGYAAPLIYKPLWEDPVRNLQQLAFPTIALGLGLSAIVARMVRSAVLEVMRDDYVRTAYAKGLARPRVILSHVLPNSLIPVVTLLGTQLGGLLGGTVIVEAVFTLPGLGSSVLESIALRDYPQFQANVLVFAGMLLLVNLIVDLLYARLDPRVRYR